MVLWCVLEVLSIRRVSASRIARDLSSGCLKLGKHVRVSSKHPVCDWHIRSWPDSAGNEMIIHANKGTLSCEFIVVRGLKENRAWVVYCFKQLTEPVLLLNQTALKVPNTFSETC